MNSAETLAVTRKIALLLDGENITNPHWRKAILGLALAAEDVQVTVVPYYKPESR